MKNKDQYKMQNIRTYVQLGFVFLCLWIGVEFYLFLKYFETGGLTAYFNRPPGVDAFLPISSMMSVYYYTLTGEIHKAHPAGFFIFLGVVSMSFLLGKSFCSWVCPVGFLSECVGDFGDWLQKRVFKWKKFRIRMPRFLDYILRSVKYLLLGFLFYVVFYTMSSFALEMFLDSPYNTISDVKMYYFFADLSRFSLIVITALFVLSIFFKNFWCRYLCPYGALLGITSLLSPVKISRDENKCIDCSLCAKACPSAIKVDKVKTVISDECSSCLRCVDSCPVKDALGLKIVPINKKVEKRWTPYIAMAGFLLFTSMGVLTGNWQNDVSIYEYEQLYKIKDSVGHPGNADKIGFGDEKKNEMNEKNPKD